MQYYFYKLNPPRPTFRVDRWPIPKVPTVLESSNSKTAQMPRLTHRNHVAAGKLLRREADRLGFRQADRLGFRQATERIAVVDGASWIREQMQLHLAELDGLGLDFFHLSENVHRARRAVFGDIDPAGSTWADELMHAFKHDGYGTAWERLLQWRASVKGSKKRKAADRLLNYVSSRKEMIRYPAFRAKGWQIGSGPTESQCKLCTKRLKGHGRRWDRINATAIAALDTLDRSSQWAKFWPNAYPVAV